MRATIPLTALRAFEAAARHLSFTRAADELCVTQTAISHQVKGLEQRLGMPLFRRSNRGLTLTDEGLGLAPTLFEAFGAIDRLFEQFEAGGGREVLTVSASRPPPASNCSNSRSMAPKASNRVGASPRPSSVSVSPRLERRKRGMPSRCSRPFTWWLIAVWVTHSSSAARVNDRWRAAASKARNAFRGIVARIGSAPTFPHALAVFLSFAAWGGNRRPSACLAPGEVPA